MRWITELLRHLGIARAAIGVVFVTSVMMFIGPHVAPTIVDPVPKEWSSVLFGTMVLSGCLLLFWAVAYIWNLFIHFVRETSKTIAASNLSSEEQSILLILGNDPTRPLNLDNLDYERGPISKLAMVQLVRQLKEKDLVSLNPWDEHLVSLTEAGRDRAFEIQCRTKTKSRA